MDWLGEWREGLQLTNEIKCLESLRPCLSLSCSREKVQSNLFKSKRSALLEE